MFEFVANGSVVMDMNYGVFDESWAGAEVASLAFGVEPVTAAGLMDKFYCDGGAGEL